MRVPWYLMAKGKGESGYKTASGPLVSVSDAKAAPLRSLLVDIEPVQTGTGVPSPDNVRPISGWSAVNVWVNPTYDPSANPTATIQLGDTYYGATLDVTNGVLTVDRYLYVYDGTESFTKSSTALNGFYNRLSPGYTPHNWPGMVNYNSISQITDEISSMFVITKNIDEYRQNYGYCFLDSGMNFDAQPETFGTTVESFKAKLAELYANGTPVSVFAKLATPITISLTPTQISTLQGQNNLWADSGNVAVEYLASGGVNADLMKLAVAFMGR